MLEYIPPVPLSGILALSVKFTHNSSHPFVTSGSNRATGFGLI